MRPNTIIGGTEDYPGLWANRAPGFSRTQLAALLVVFAIAVAAATFVCAFYFFRLSNQATMWLPNAVLMAALIVLPIRYWPVFMIIGAMAQALVVQFAFPQFSIADATAISVAGWAEATIGAAILGRSAREAPWLNSLTFALRVFVVAGLIATAATALLGASYLAVIALPASTVAFNFPIWWFSEVLGVLVLLPVALAFTGRSVRTPIRSGRQIAELLAVSLGLGLVVLLIFSSQGEGILSALDHPYMLFPLLFWLILRFDERFVTVALFVICLSIIRFTDTGFGPFSDSSQTVQETLLTVQSFVLVLTISSLFMMALVGERRRLVLNRLRMEMQLRNSQKLESLGTLAGGVAHDINNPLTGIVNYADLAQSEIDPDHPAQEFIGEIVREGEHIRSIVQNLLTFAREDTGDRETCSAEEIIESTLRLVETLIRHDNIYLDVEIEENLPPIRCDSQAIRQVLLNLVTNGRDALNERFTNPDENKRLRIVVERTSHSDKEWVRFLVKDFGIGIAEKDLPRVFDPFFTTKGRATGTGLGLSISYGIVQEHDGRFLVESEIGHYTQFWFDLPAES